VLWGLLHLVNFCFNFCFLYVFVIKLCFHWSW
jgi:hypothetical protein